MPTTLNRAACGFAAGALSVLIFHQGMWQFLHAEGLMPVWYPNGGVPPLGVPRIADMAFWGGVWGALFGLVLPKLPSRVPMVILGLGLGIAAALVSLFIMSPLHGLPIAGGGDPMAIVKNLLINGFWGIGVGLIMPMMLRRDQLQPA